MVLQVVPGPQHVASHSPEHEQRHCGLDQYDQTPFPSRSVHQREPSLRAGRAAVKRHRSAASKPPDMIQSTGPPQLRQVLGGREVRDHCPNNRRRETHRLGASLARCKVGLEMAKPPREMLSVLLRSGDGRVVPTNQQEEIGMEATVEALRLILARTTTSRPGALSRFFRMSRDGWKSKYKDLKATRQRRQEPPCPPDQEPRAVEDQSRESGRADHHPGSRDRRVAGPVGGVGGSRKTSSLMALVNRRRQLGAICSNGATCTRASSRPLR